MRMAHQPVTGVRQITLEGLLEQKPGVGGQETKVVPHSLRQGMGLSVHPEHHSGYGFRP